MTYENCSTTDLLSYRYGHDSKTTPAKSVILSLIHIIMTLTVFIETIKTTSMENVSTGELDKNKEHYLRCQDKAEKSYDVY